MGVPISVSGSGKAAVTRYVRDLFGCVGPIEFFCAAQRTQVEDSVSHVVTREGD